MGSLEFNIELWREWVYWSSILNYCGSPMGSLELNIELCRQSAALLGAEC